jgi:Fe-S cluster assembly iron-binding protein IscA
VHAPGECASEELALRLVVMGDRGFGLIMDIPRNGDQIIERDGVKLLLVGHDLVDSVRGLVLDCVDVPGGRTLTFTAGQA